MGRTPIGAYLDSHYPLKYPNPHPLQLVYIGALSIFFMDPSTYLAGHTGGPVAGRGRPGQRLASPARTRAGADFVSELTPPEDRSPREDLLLVLMEIFRSRVIWSRVLFQELPPGPEAKGLHLGLLRPLTLSKGQLEERTACQCLMPFQVPEVRGQLLKDLLDPLRSSTSKHGYSYYRKEEVLTVLPPHLLLPYVHTHTCQLKQNVADNFVIEINAKWNTSQNYDDKKDSM